MAERSHKTDSIFWEALQVEGAEERAAYLDQECTGDADLRAQLEDMLAAYPKVESFLEQPAVDFASTIDQRLPDTPGMQIGPYKLLQQIGEGGFGVVFMAEQTAPVRRKVALKVIKPGMDTRQVIARFEAERQALAMMDHPNIAKVFEAGATDSGRPYFVMELVSGIPVTQFCDEQHLTTRERLELFVPVCEAVQHAHQKGIIHRDLKPSNILVALYDSRPVPKVIDFGVAKAVSQQLTEQTMFTALGQIVGTIEYMSPEQAQRNQLDIDTRSDVYSLGVVLYELLTGSTPFDKQRLRSAAIDELLRIIREEEPPMPSTKLSSSDTLPTVAANRRIESAKLSGLIRGELDWIVMKALEKDRARRYETANGLATDLQRYLADEPVLAGPPSGAYRFRKFARRNRTALAMAAVVTVALIAGIVGTTWQAIRATQQRDRAVIAEDLAQTRLESEGRARREADEARTKAEANFQQARQVVDDMYTQVAEKWLAHQPNLEPLQREFLQKALQFYTEFAQQHSTDRAVRLETARAYRRVADIQHRLGQRGASEQTFHRAIDQLQSLVDEHPATPTYRRELAEALHKLGANFSNTRGHVAAEKAHRRALALEVKLAADFPTVPEYRRDLGRGYCFLGRVLRHIAGQEAAAEAEQAFRSALTIQQSLVAEFPAVAEYRQQLADSHLGFAENQRTMGRPQECRQELLNAATQLEQLVADFPAIPDFRSGLANVYFWFGVWLSPANIELWLRKALVLQEKLAADFPAVTDYRYDLFRTLNSLGIVLLKRNRAADAEQSLRRAVEIGETLAAESPKTHYYRSRLARAYKIRADVLWARGNLPESATAYERSISLYEDWMAEFPDVTEGKDEVLDSYMGLAHLLEATDRPQEAEQIYRKHAEDFSVRAQAYSQKGDRMRDAGRPQEAESAYRRSIVTWYESALVRCATDDTPGYQGACARMLKQFAQTDDEVMAHFVAWSCALGPGALTDFAPAIALAETAAKSDAQSAQFVGGLGAILYRAGRFDEARQELEQAVRLPSSVDASRLPPQYPRFFLAMAHHRLGNSEEARQWYDKARLETDTALIAHDIETAHSPWNRRLTLNLLRREAEMLLNFNSAPRHTTIPTNQSVPVEAEKP